MRFLAIDPGDKRTGVAVGDDRTGLVTPHRVVEAPWRVRAGDGPDALLDAILADVEAFAPDALVVGLPLNMDGTEGPQARRARALGTALAARTGLDVHHQDERLTSFAAEQQLNRSGRTHAGKKAVRDALAAAAILQDFLDARDRT